MEILKAVKEVISEAKLVKEGKKEDKFFVDFKVRPLTKKDLEEIQKKLPPNYLILTASSAYDKEKGDCQRIYYKVFKDEKEKEEFVKYLEEARKRDHRFLGEQLDLFHFEEDVIGSGLPIFHPKGQILRMELIKYMREVNKKLKCSEVWTPHLSKTVLWKISGHYDKYRDKMFIWEDDGEEWGLKPMNCPIHVQIYKFNVRSYRDLPIRYSEFATVYRKEQSGELHGLTRVWSLTQDDHHFFVRKDQIKEEIKKIIEAIISVYKSFGLPFKMNLSTKPEKYIGSDEIWEISENALKEVLDEYGEYEIKEGEGAFYGPKIDFEVKDSLGRWWQLATIQVDFNLPERFNLTYVNEKGEEERPVIIHFAILGSLERFIGIITEHYGGKFPTWLAPIQVRIIPVSEKVLEYAEKVRNKLEEEEIRVDLDAEGTVEYRIRKAEMEKIPHIIVVGKKEESNNSVTDRYKGKMKTLKLEEFIEKIKEEIGNRIN